MTALALKEHPSTQKRKKSGAIGTPTLFLQNPTLNKITIKDN